MRSPYLGCRCAVHIREVSLEARLARSETLGFSIRLAETRDAAAIAAIYAPYVTGSPVSFETEAPDAAEIGRRENLRCANFGNRNIRG